MLMQRIENLIFRKAAPMAIRHLAQPNLAAKEPLTRKVLDQALHEFQLAPPLTLHIAAPQLLAGIWSATRETYVVNVKGRAMREAVAAAVSKLNECPYCVTVHASMYVAAGGDTSSPMPNDIAKASQWAAATLSPDDRPSSQIAANDIPQIYGTAFVYHYINRMVSVFLADSPIALPGMTSAPGKKLARAAFAFMGKRMVSQDPQPGQSPGLVEAELPREFQWATPAPAVANALASFASIAENAGLEAVPSVVRALVLEHLSSWRGEQPPLSRAWINALTASLDETHKPIATLALLTARAPWQIDDAVIADFRKNNPDDKALVQVTAWAAYSAARHVAGWF
jgi:AhpD family alkylhydroperoxidase